MVYIQVTGKLPACGSHDRARVLRLRRDRHGGDVYRRQPRGRRDRCTDCTADLLAISRKLVADRRAEIAALRVAGRWRAAKPFHTAPLFAWLREVAEGER